jgi:hypothetical protein
MAYSQSFAVFNPEIWSPSLNRAFQAKLKAAAFFSDYSDDITGGGEKIWIPAMSNAFTATAIATTSGDVALTAVSETSGSITLDQWMGVSYPITDYQKALIATKYNIQAEYAQKMGYALAKKIDTDLLALGASITKGTGDSATNITATTIETAIAFIESSNIPKEECAFIFHPNAYYGEVVKSQKLVDASYYGTEVLSKGFHSTLYGIPVMILSQVPAGTAGTEGGHRNLLVHKNAIAYAVARGGAKMSEKASESLRTKLIADVIYGKTCLNAGSGIRIISNN